MTLNELIKELQEIRVRNMEPEIPDFDPGDSMEVRIQSEDGTFESAIRSVETPNEVWFIVDEPNYSPID